MTAAIDGELHPSTDGAVDDVNEDPEVWQHVIAVTQPALLLASTDFVDEIAERLGNAGVQDAVSRHDALPIFDWIVPLLSLQGISDDRAFAFDAQHRGIAFGGVRAAFEKQPSCPRLQGYWAFSGGGYRKGSGTCAEPAHRPHCPLPVHPLRKGGLNVAAYGLFLFVRDVCDSDLVGWIDARLAAADPCLHAWNRSERLQAALLDPLVNVAGTGRKLWSMILAELLLVGDPDRERWVATGAGMIAVDTLVHNFLHRTGILRGLAADHPYGDRCYQPGGCADVVTKLSRQIDARRFNPSFPADFPRFVQHAICAVLRRWRSRHLQRQSDQRSASLRQRFLPGRSKLRTRRTQTIQSVQRFSSLGPVGMGILCPRATTYHGAPQAGSEMIVGRGNLCRQHGKRRLMFLLLDPSPILLAMATTNGCPALKRMVASSMSRKHTLRAGGLLDSQSRSQATGT